MAVLLTAGVVAVFVTAGLHGRAVTISPPQTASSQPAQPARSFDGYSLKPAKVLSASGPGVPYATVRIDKGSTDGVSRGDPVIAGGALVGAISSVGAKYAIVAGLDSAKFEVQVRVLDSRANGRKFVGVLRPVPGIPKSLEVAFLSKGEFSSGDEVVTAGFTDPHFSFAYPPGIPVGTIVLSYQQVITGRVLGVSPIVNLQTVSRVEILLKHR